MPTYPPIQAAVPPTGGGAVNKTLLRDAITNRTAYILGNAESAGDLVCVDPDTGAAIVAIIYKGRLFWYDATDMSSADDGITVLVSYEGRRYKLSDGADVFAYSVLSKSLSAPPVSPTPDYGDAYLVAAAATGDWAGFSDYVAVWTERGPQWEFIDFGVGRLIYVEDLDAYYHRDSGGTWVSGFGNLVIGANSVPLSAAINFGRRVIVENSTTTAPPGTASVGTAYRIGAGATGAWSGHDDDIAICEVANTFTIYDPSNGWLIFDKNAGTEYRYNGSAWISASGSWVARQSLATASGSTTAPSGTTVYNPYSSSTAPTTSQRRLIDTATISHTAKKTGAILRFEFGADAVMAWAAASLSVSLTTMPPVIALYRDSVANALDWQMVATAPFDSVLVALANTLSPPATMFARLAARFEYAAPDTSAHTYRIAIHTGVVNNSASGLDVSTLTRRLFTVQEAA